MPEYPHTIKSGAGEELTFVRRARDAEGEYLEVENLVRPGAGPPMHVHHFQEEGLTVRQGRLGYQRRGGVPKFAAEGESVAFKPGELHRFWNAGDGPLVCSGYVRPPDNIEYFLGALYDSQRRRGGKGPDPFEAAFLAHHFRSEFGVAALPPVVQRLLFPPMVMLGRALGKHRRYSDAPEPRRR